MSFLSGLFLFALPIIAIPIALHFYQRKQRDTIPWGAMRFLLQDSPRGNWWRDLERYLILFLRCLALAALVFALARPMLNSTIFSSGNADRLVVLLLDDSLSTDFQLRGGKAIFATLKTQANEIITRLPTQTRLQVILGASGGRPLVSEPVLMTSTNREQILSGLEKLKPTQGTTHLLDGLQSVLAMPMDDSLLSAQVFVLTDQQPKSWNPEAQYRWQQLIESAQNLDPPLAITAMSCPLARDAFVNLSVARITSSATRTSPTQPLAFLAEIENSGQQVSSNVTLIWKVDGIEQTREELEAIQPGESRSARWVHQLADAGVHLVTCQIETDDVLPLDNSMSLAIEIVDQLPILIVTSEQETSYETHEANFVQAALGTTSPDQLSSWQSVFRPKIIPQERLSETPLDPYQVVMLLGTSGTLPEEAMSKLRQFVDDGGGLWITLGQQTDPELFNKHFVAGGSGLVPCQIKGLKDYGRQTEKTGEVHPPEGSHPATMLLSDTQRLDIDQVQVYREFQFRPPAGAKDHRVLLKSGNGLPMAIESYLGKGRVICLNLPLDEKWSTLPLSKSFVVMVNDWLSYLSSPKGIQYNVMPGQSLACRLDTRQLDAQSSIDPSTLELMIVDPTSAEIPLKTQMDEATLSAAYSLTQLPGVYSMTLAPQGEGTEPKQSPLKQLTYVVARDSDESHLANLSSEDQSKLTSLSGIDWYELSPNGEVSQAASIITTKLQPSADSRARTPLWTTALICLLTAFLLELFLSSRASVSRFGYSAARV